MSRIRQVCFLCGILFLLPVLSHAKLDQLKIGKARDYVTAKVTMLMLEEFVKTSPNSEANLQIVEHDLGELQIENPPNFQTLQKALAGKFDKTLLKLSEPINKTYTEGDIDLSAERFSSKMTDSAFYILNKSYPDLGSLLETHKTSTYNEIFNFLNVTSPVVKIDTLNIQLIDSMVNASLNSKGFFSFSKFNFWTLLPLLLIVAFLIIRAVSNDLEVATAGDIKELSDRIEKRKNEIEALRRKLEGVDVGKDKDIKSKVEVIIADSLRINMIQRDIDRILEMLKNDGMDSNKGIVKQVKLSKSEDSSVSEIFYMGGPVNNYFPNSARSSNKENTVYKFTVRGNRQEANFEIHTSGAPVNEIASRNESYIKPACDEENLPKANVKNIVTQRPGYAILEGDKWTIKTKALIRYE